MLAKLKASFHRNGYVIIKDFFAQTLISNTLSEYKKIVRSFQSQQLGTHFFSGGYAGEQNADKYFFESSDKIWPFFNSQAKAHPNILIQDLSNEENLFAYLKVMNKTGHNLHGKNRVFHDLFFHDSRLTEIAQSLGYDEPCTSIFQTTVISKSRVEDSQYKPHQDGSYLGAGGKVLAYWIPLTPSRKNNGCLWGIPGSHTTPLNWWYRKENSETYRCHYIGQEPQWNLANKIYLEVNPGDLLLFSGNFVHGSSPATKLPNDIQDLRIALTYHLGPTTGWNELIWLKLKTENTLPLYKNIICIHCSTISSMLSNFWW